MIVKKEIDVQINDKIENEVEYNFNDILQDYGLKMLAKYIKVFVRENKEKKNYFGK